MDYGAKADGVTDDSPYIQAAVNACYKAGGGTVYLPAGTYRLNYADSSWAPPGIQGSRNNDCSDSVDLLDNVTIRGAGTGQTVVQGTRDSSHPFGATMRSNVCVRDMTIQAPGTTGVDGVKFYACTNARIENVVAHDLYIGLSMPACRTSTITDCVAYNCSMGIAVGESMKRYQDQANVTVVGCEAYACMDGFSSGGQYSRPEHLTAERSNGLTLVDCNSHDNTRFGFFAHYASNFQMTRCRATNNQYNILLGGVINNSDGASTDQYGLVKPLGTGRTIHGTTFGGTGGTAVTQLTAATPTDYSYLYDYYGACSGIVED